MISRSKFNKLKKITKYFRIASELKSVRDCLVLNETPDMSVLYEYTAYLCESGESEFTDELAQIALLKDRRILLEKIHFLYHRIRDHFGYSDNETGFNKSSQDSRLSKLPQTELVVILENLRSAHNTGSIIRSCECFGVKELIFCGITPGPDNERVKKTAKGTEANIKIARFNTISEAVTYLRTQNYEIIGAETGKGSVNLKDYQPEKRTAIIFGNEELGLTSEAAGLCDCMVSIEMRGKKNSLNVANCASIFIYDFTGKIS